MKTLYKPQISPFQAVGKKAVIGPQSPHHPLYEEVRRNCGTFDLSASFDEDKATLEMFKHIPGLIAFVCTLRKGSRVIGQGRGTAIISKVNRFIDRTVRAAFSASLVDAVMKAKLLDALSIAPSQEKVEIGEAYKAQVESDEMATDRQKSYLRELVQVNVEDDEERNRWESQIESMTKWDASEAIQSFAK